MEQMDQIQQEMAKKVVKQDLNWLSESVPLKYVGGIDTRYLENDTGLACAGLIIFDVSNEEEFVIVYEDYKFMNITVEYKPGYLAVRYLEIYKNMIEELNQKRPDIFPQLMLVRAGGVLHHNRCGLASHLGIICDVPTIGVQESMLLGPNLGLKMGVDVDTGYNKLFTAEHHSVGEYSEIADHDGHVLGVALVSSEGSKRPTYVSIGHRVSLDTAIDIVLSLSTCRIPEPIRQVRISCREKLLEHVAKN